MALPPSPSSSGAAVNMAAPAGCSCTLRGLAFGTLGCIIVGTGFQYSDMVLSV